MKCGRQEIGKNRAFGFMSKAREARHKLYEQGGAANEQERERERERERQKCAFFFLEVGSHGCKQ